jgi:hypothetical protein
VRFGAAAPTAHGIPRRFIVLAERDEASRGREAALLAALVVTLGAITLP